MRQHTEKVVRAWRHRCSAEIAAVVLAGAWKPSIMHALYEESVLRFGELNRRTEGLSDRGLTRQLRELEEDGLITRTVYPEVPPKVEYRLTPLGVDAQAVVDVMADWGGRYADRQMVDSAGEDRVQSADCLPPCDLPDHDRFLPTKQSTGES